SLLGAICRTGKQYIIGKVISLLYKERRVLLLMKDSNSSSPDEEIYNEYEDFERMECKHIRRYNEILGNSSCVYYTSLVTARKLMSRSDIKKFDLIVIDEAHNGGST